MIAQGTTAPPRAMRLGCIAEQPGEMGLPGYNLHPLKGDRRGAGAVQVSGNWRVTFRFDGPDATDVNYEDYH